MKYRIKEEAYYNGVKLYYPQYRFCLIWIQPGYLENIFTGSFLGLVVYGTVVEARRWIAEHSSKPEKVKGPEITYLYDVSN